MLVLLSPAKKLDEGPFDVSLPVTEVELASDIEELVRACRSLSLDALQQLMDVSDKLAELNHGRFQSMAFPFTVENSKPAALLFAGDAYRGLDASSLSAEDLAFGQSHLRILSGLYGVLRPLDLIQPYRLEMGRRLETSRGKNLYEFWGDRITEALNRALVPLKEKTVVHLSSDEYFKAVNPKALDGRVLTITFREQRDGKLRFISFYAKEARGLMTRYILQNRIEDRESLKDFSEAAYRFRPDLSSDDEYVFVRPDQR